MQLAIATISKMVWAMMSGTGQSAFILLDESLFLADNCNQAAMSGANVLPSGMSPIQFMTESKGAGAGLESPIPAK
jgi:hypothetical protein